MTIYRKTNQEKYRKDRFYAAYIQELRKYYEVPQKDLAKILHVSNSSLSRMESGQANMDVDLFNHAIEYFEKYDPDYKFNRKIAQLEEAEQWIDRCVQDFIHLSYFKKLDEMKIYLDQENNKHSFAYFHYKIVESFYDLFQNTGTAEDIKKIIDSQYFVSEYYVSILYDLCGIIEDAIDLDVIGSQIQYLQKALRCARQIDHHGLIGLIEYHLMYRLDDLNKPMQALELVKNCKEHLQQAGAYRRILTVQMNEGILYRKLRIYSKAIEIFTNLSVNKEQVIDHQILTSLYDNFSWCLFIQEKDEQALEYAMRSRELGSSFPDIYIVLVFSSYRLKRFDQCKNFAQEFIDQERKEDRALTIKLFMQLMIKVLNQELDVFDLEAQITSLLPFYRAIELEIPFYSSLIDYYRQQNDLEQVIVLQEKLIQYLKFNNAFH